VRPRRERLPGPPSWTGPTALPAARLAFVALGPLVASTGLAVAYWFVLGDRTASDVATGLAAAMLLAGVAEALVNRVRLAVGEGWVARGAGARWRVLRVEELSAVTALVSPAAHRPPDAAVLRLAGRTTALDVFERELRADLPPVLARQVPAQAHVDAGARRLLPLPWHPPVDAARAVPAPS
jgi:hypothetical protein